ncbi:MAG: hypothetical protein K6C05_01360 [Anaerovibrio sp.]|uniref:ArdC family protein n=1 Tax=Anaerovibrio sp. TaxID=1872532 RepID=UPI0025F4129C|nr:ArdC family protein [Anaerovibrio sp.]MCR5175477.1 hypothetical protein [Anaerovibrio sp.]
MKKTNDEIIKDAVDQLMEMFRTGKLPERVAFSIIHRHPGDIIPSDSWSIGNRILQMLQGTTDARGYKQWQAAGRQVKKGAKAIHILAPMAYKVTGKDKLTGEDIEKIIIKGYRPIPVFRYEDTDGAPLPYDHEYRPSQSPTFFDAADKLGINVSYRPVAGKYLGKYSINTNSIQLCSQDAIVYYHELAHAIHATFVDLRVYDDAKSEIVAEFSALVLANIAGINGFEAQGFDYIEHYAKKHGHSSIMQEMFSVLNDVEKIVTTVLNVSEDELELAAV